MKNSVSIDTRLKSKIEYMDELQGTFCVKFKDISDAFWFGNILDIQEFLHIQAKERFYDKEVRKGYFDYVNDVNETLRYYINVVRGNVTVINEENLGLLS